MGVTGHDGIQVFLGASDQNRLERDDRLEQPAAGRPDIEPQVEGNLVIATPARMQLAAERTQLLPEQLLDRHVDVLGTVEGISVGDIRLDFLQRVIQALLLLARQHADPNQRLGPRPTAADVLAEEPAVHVE